ncbi:MAG: PHP domain-containing protein [Methanotrichaceae archaeon]|nr:PHP domain-containing protein [Methanotrichaceae archaeon]
MIYDLHVHSKYSYDSILSLEKIINLSRKKGLDGIAITDHATIKGGLEALRINKHKDFQTIIGMEVKTEFGDIIGIFLNSEISSNEINHVFEDIKSQGGLVILPHPFRNHKNIESIMHKVDLVEGFNARSKCIENMNSQELAKGFNKSMTAGSDAHFSYELGNGKTIVYGDLETELRKGRMKITGKESSYYLSHGSSVIISELKKWIE